MRWSGPGDQTQDLALAVGQPELSGGAQPWAGGHPLVGVLDERPHAVEHAAIALREVRAQAVEHEADDRVGGRGQRERHLILDRRRAVEQVIDVEAVELPTGEEVRPLERLEPASADEGVLIGVGAEDLVRAREV